VSEVPPAHKGPDPLVRGLDRAVNSAVTRLPGSWRLLRAPVRRFFDSRAAGWDERAGSGSAEHVAPLLAALDQLPARPGHIPDIGTGTGAAALALAGRYPEAELDVPADRIYLDHGLTGTHRSRPGLDQALAAVREGDTLIVTKLDRLARSVPDARAIGDDLAARGVKLSLGGQVYDLTDPMGKMFYSIRVIFAEFEVDLLRARTREGMAVARTKGKLRGRAPKLSSKQQRELVRMHSTGEYTIADLADVFTVSAPRYTAPCTATPLRAAEPPTVHPSQFPQALYPADPGLALTAVPLLLNPYTVEYDEQDRAGRHEHHVRAPRSCPQ